VAQEVFVKAFFALQKFRGESAFYTWLYSIGINSGRHFLTRHSPANTYPLDIPGGREAVVLPEQLKDYTTPETVVIEYELALQLSTSIAALSHDMRRTLLLREIGGLSYEEIAERTRDPVGNVRSRLLRARLALLRTA
jgi:RNA polymerase sigma-70 factor (ECF subfamily)